jgi:hypothetical protein
LTVIGNYVVTEITQNKRIFKNLKQMDENKINKRRESEENAKIKCGKRETERHTKAHLLPTEILTVLSQEETLIAIVVIFGIARNRRRIGCGIRLEGHIERLRVIIQWSQLPKYT